MPVRPFSLAPTVQRSRGSGSGSVEFSTSCSSAFPVESKTARSGCRPERSASALNMATL